MTSENAGLEKCSVSKSPGQKTEVVTSTYTITEDDKHVYKLFLNSQSHLPTEMLQTASNFSVSAGETGQKSVDNVKNLGKCLDSKVQNTVTQIWFPMLLSYYSRKTHSHKQGIMSKCTCSTTNFVEDKPTAIIKPKLRGLLSLQQTQLKVLFDDLLTTHLFKVCI